MNETWISSLDTVSGSTLTTSLYKNRIKNKNVQMRTLGKYKDRQVVYIKTIRHFEANEAIEFYQNRLDKKEGNEYQRKSWQRNIRDLKEIVRIKSVNNNQRS